MTAAFTEVPDILRGKAIAVVDVEGNGQSPPEIIEIAVVSVSGAVVSADDVRSWLVRPQSPITPIVTRKVHGIGNSDVEGCPRWAAVSPAIAQVLDGRTVVAHNAIVEQRVLSAHLPDWQPPMVLDTLRLARALWPGLPGYGLDKLIEYAKLDTTAMREQGYHRAGYDAWAAWQLLCRLIRDSGLDWDGLVRVGGLPEFVPAPEPDGGLW